jgi:hypothetical protein
MIAQVFPAYVKSKTNPNEQIMMILDQPHPNQLCWPEAARVSQRNLLVKPTLR